MLRFDSEGAEGDDKDGGRSASRKKTEANRRNAQLSTGPKTEAGKNHSRQNALKHGVLASALLVTKGGGAEDAAEFEELLHALNRDLAPVGRLEEMIGEKIAVCWWRQKRALRYEALMIRRASVAASPADCQWTEEIITRVDDGRKEVAAAETTLRDFQRIGLLPKDLEEPPAPEAETQATKLLSLFEERSDEELREKAIYHFGLPADADMNRILRYETSIQRQLVHAINQLERMQRARKGEHVPAPVTVQLSSD